MQITASVKHPATNQMVLDISCDIEGLLSFGTQLGEAITEAMVNAQGAN